MSLPTIFADETLGTGLHLPLRGREAWHALGVRRLSVGDVVRVINGRGTLALARVDTIAGPHDASLSIQQCEQVQPLVPDIRLATAVPKGDRQATLLDMATQLGISAWQPLLCARSVNRVGKNSYERWQRICLEACKQSGAAYLPTVLPEARPVAAVEAARAEGRRILLAHPGGALPSAGEDGAQSACLLVIGPEGGFEEREVDEMLALGALPVNLGPQILRIETAAVALLARLRIS